MNGHNHHRVRRRSGLSGKVSKRSVKTALHLMLLAAVIFSLTSEGAKLADWSFVALSLLIEVGL